jgi:hypothetical protein
MALASSEASIFFIGLKHTEREPPEGCKSAGGSIVSDKMDLAVLHFKCQEKHFIVFDRLTHKDENGTPHWEVVDFASLPKLRKDESIEHNDCTSQLGGYTLAIAKWRTTNVKTYAYRISYAIRLNMATSKFEVLNPKQVKCEYSDDRN